jgi:hypothetical protein
VIFFAMLLALKRLANKVIWALEDIVAICRTTRPEWQEAMERAEQRMDPQMLMALARMRDAFAEIERKARDARRGEYDGQ